MILEIWSTTDRFFSHFGPFFALLHPPPLTTQRIKVLKKWLYTILFLRYGVWWMQLLHFTLGNFLPFHTPNCPKTKIKKKKKKKPLPGYIIILHKSTKNHDPTLYCSWDMAHDTCDFYFSFWVIFCTFTP